MLNNIVNLEDARKTTAKIYEQTSETYDPITGEMTRDNYSFVKAVKTKDDFVKLFISNLDFLQSLSNAENKVLFYAMKNLNYANAFFFTNVFIKYFVDNDILSRASVYNSIKSLVEKNVFIKATEELKKEFGLYGNDIYFVNPNIIGKGSFGDLKELRKTIIKTFDFENLKMKQETITEAKYTGLSEVVENLNNHEVKQITRQVSPDEKNTSTEILVGEKNYNDVIDIEASATENKNSSLEQEEKNLKLKLKIIEAENESKRLENAKLDKEIELMKLKKGAQPSFNFGDSDK